MNRDKLIRELRAYAKEKGLTFSVDTKKGKGSHYLVTSETRPPPFNPTSTRAAPDGYASNSGSPDWRPRSRARPPRNDEDLMMQWEYATRIEQVDGDHVVTVRDLPEVCTSGDTREQAIELAADAIDVVLAHRIEKGLDLPAPSKAQRGEILIAPPLQTQAKAALYAAWRASEISKSELARRLGVRETEARRILDPRHATRLETLDAAGKALGVRLAVSTRAA